jgi:hypothetical protein
MSQGGRKRHGRPHSRSGSSRHRLSFPIRTTDAIAGSEATRPSELAEPDEFRNIGSSWELAVTLPQGPHNKVVAVGAVGEDGTRICGQARVVPNKNDDLLLESVEWGEVDEPK